MKTLRQVPVFRKHVKKKSAHNRQPVRTVEGNEWDNIIGDELVNEVGVEFDSLGIHGIVTTTLWDDPGPGYREAVRLDTVCLQEGNILLPQFIGISGYISIFSVELHSDEYRVCRIRTMPYCMARKFQEVIPDGFSATINIYRA